MTAVLPGGDRLVTADERGAPRRIVDLQGGRTIAMAQAGDGPDLLAIHGTLVTLEDMWLGPVPLLTESFRVTAVDRPGHGLSERKRRENASPWRQAELIHEAALAIGLRRPVLLGHSYGGTVALAYATLFPEDVTGVVAIAPMGLPELRVELVLFGPRVLPGIGTAVASFAEAVQDPALLPLLWRAMFLPQAMPRAYAHAFPFSLAGRGGQMVAVGEDAAALPAALLRLATRYGSCHVPVRIMGGTADLVVNNATQGQVVAALLPKGSFSWLAGYGHMLHHFDDASIARVARSLVARAP